MPFVDLAELRRSEVLGADECYITVGEREVTIVPGGAAAKLGWKVGTSLRVLVGNEEDEGDIILKPGPGWKLRAEKARAKLRIRREAVVRPIFPKMPTALKATRSHHRVDDGALIIRLPWYRDKFPERAEADDPPSKPDDAETAKQVDARTSAGNGSEVEARPSAAVDQHTLPPASNEVAAAPQGTPGNAGEAGGSPAPRAVSNRLSHRQAEEFIQADARGATWTQLTAIISKPPGNYSGGAITSLRKQYADRIAAARTVRPVTDDPATWPEAVRDAFKAAAEKGASAQELADICGRKVGVLDKLIRTYFPPSFNEARLEAIRNRVAAEMAADSAHSALEEKTPAPAPQPTVDPSNPLAWPKAIRDRLINAAARGERAEELSAICGVPAKQVEHLVKRFFSQDVAAEKKKLQSPPSPPRIEPVGSAWDRLSADELRILRDEAQPVLEAAPFRIKTADRNDGRHVYVEGEDVTPYMFLKLANERLEELGDPLIKLELTPP